MKPCEVLGGNADCWTSMTNGWPPYFNINDVPPITYWWIWMPLEGVKISIGTHTRNGSTMINTSRHAKIDAQELFYFTILPVGGTLIDPAVSLKTRIELYTDAQGTLIFDNYDECSPKNHERTERIVRRWSTIGYNIKLQMLLLRQEMIMKNKTKWGLSALVSSRRLDERTAVESHIKGLNLTSRCRHHNTVLVSKSCIRRTQCHQVPLWRYGFLSAYSCTLQN